MPLRALKSVLLIVFANCRIHDYAD